MNRIALLGIPYDLNSSYMRGAAQAPALIRKAFQSDASHQWSESGLNLGSPEVLYDTGDIAFSMNGGFAEPIEAAIMSILDDGDFPLSLGGDHSVTYPVVKALNRKYPKLKIIHFDAHPDLYANFEENPYSHASPFARIMENCQGISLTQLGIRSFTPHLNEQILKFNVQLFSMNGWKEDPVIASGDPVYISFDLDALDPSCAPGVSHPEPGGLSVRQALNVIANIQGKVIGADIVEYNPQRDLYDLTAVTAAKLLKEIGGKIISSQSTL